MPLKYINKLEGKRVLIVGGTSGIGFAIAEECLEYGAIVTVASSRQTSVDDALSRLQKAYPQFASNVNGHTVDLRSDDVEKSVKELLDFTTENGKHKLDHIADTAGDSLAIQPIEEATVQYILDSQRVRWIGTIMLAKHAKEHLNVSSASSLTLTGGVNSHAPGKNWFLPAGVGSGKEGLARGLAVDLAPIRVNLVAPGAIYTELFGKVVPDKAALEKFVEGFKKSTLVQQIGAPEDVAEAYVYCMKDKFLTGQCILSEGGQLLSGALTR